MSQYRYVDRKECQAVIKRRESAWCRVLGEWREQAVGTATLYTLAMCRLFIKGRVHTLKAPDNGFSEAWKKSRDPG